MTVVPDTNIWIGWLAHRTLDRDAWGGALGRVLVSTIVLQELWAGVSNVAERADLRRIYELARRRRTLSNPPAVAWVLSGEALQALRTRRSIGSARLRALRNDALLAATAFAEGATIITRNTRDFELLSHVMPVAFRTP
jgi:predicted nucleic acid-binding protein